MSEESSSDKTEEPTARRQEKFREEGNIARSQDIGGVAVLAATLMLFSFYGGTLYKTLASGVVQFWTTLDRVTLGEPQSVIVNAMGDAGTVVMKVLGTIALCAMAVGVMAGVAQTGGNVSTKVFEPKWEKFNPITGIQKQILSLQKLQDVGLALVKAGFLGVILFVMLKDALPDLINLPRMSLQPAMILLGELFLDLFMTALIVSAALATVDYLLSKRRIHNQMKMTKQEVKDEAKQMEGDPKVKAQIRKRMMEIGMNRVLNATANADVVIVNPTHYSVALRYQTDKEGAPRLLAKGKDTVAFKIREVARQNQVPIVSNPPVARSVYRMVQIGNEIPEELYEVVARVLAYVYKMGKRAAA